MYTSGVRGCTVSAVVVQCLNNIDTSISGQGRRECTAQTETVPVWMFLFSTARYVAMVSDSAWSRALPVLYQMIIFWAPGSYHSVLALGGAIVLQQTLPLDGDLLDLALLF